MKGRSWAVLALLAAVSTVFAGCIEGLQSLSEDDAGITAKDNQDLAANAAAAWDPAAFLIGAVTIESQDPRAGVPSDVTVADGRSPFWYYAYGAPESDETRLFQVLADGTVTTEERLPSILGTIEFAPTPAGEWPMDSNAAIAAAQGHAEVAPVFAGANLSLMEGLAHHPEKGATSWFVVAFSDAGFVLALVDPTTGAVTVEDVEMPEIPQTPGLPPMAALSFAPPLVITDEGALDESEPEKSWTFEASEGMDGVFEFTASTHQAFDTFEWTLLDPSGNVVAWDTVRAWGPTGGDFEYVFELAFEESGEYTLAFAATNTVGPLWTPIPPQPIDYWFELTVGHDLVEESEVETEG